MTVNGNSLNLAAVAAVARCNVAVQLDKVTSLFNESLEMMKNKIDSGVSVYGVSTGYGGSADTRSKNPALLGRACLQMLNCGVITTTITGRPGMLPLSDPLSSTTMPESWIRGAILIRINSLLRGHSAVRWNVVEKMKELLNANITPVSPFPPTCYFSRRSCYSLCQVVPLRGSISASGGEYALRMRRTQTNRLSRLIALVLRRRDALGEPRDSGLLRVCESDNARLRCSERGGHRAAVVGVQGADRDLEWDGVLCVCGCAGAGRRAEDGGAGACVLCDGRGGVDWDERKLR